MSVCIINKRQDVFRPLTRPILSIDIEKMTPQQWGEVLLKRGPVSHWTLVFELQKFCLTESQIGTQVASEDAGIHNFCFSRRKDGMVVVEYYLKFSGGLVVSHTSLLSDPLRYSGKLWYLGDD